MSESVCARCVHLKVYPAVYYTANGDGQPEDRECLEDSENFTTVDGCYRFEEE